MNKYAFTPNERIRRAAVRVSGQIHEGVSHFDAIEAASKHSNTSFNDIVDKHPSADLEGFTTSTGRFVDRVEAAKIADRAGQSKIKQGQFNSYLRRPAMEKDK